MADQVIIAMGNSTNWRRIFGWLSASFLIALLSFLLVSGRTSDITSIHSRRILRGRELNSSSPEIRLQTDRRHQKVVIMDNGVVELTFTNPNGDVIGIKYKGIDNLLEFHNAYTNRGYWDIVWGEGTTGKIANHYDKLHGTKFKIIKQDEEGIEISFSRKWSNSSGALPLSVDKRYVMLRDYPGFYTYGIFEHPKEAPALQFGNLRVAFKLQQDKFQYMAISDEQQRMMPFAKDRTNGQPLAYPEAVLLTNTSNPIFQGEVDDKYQYSMDHKDMKVHGWTSSEPNVGFWVITPNQEYLTGGPMKQELTSHVGPTALSMYMSCHYAGIDMLIKLEEGESWKKVFGPTPIYFNSVSNNENHQKSLWENAKKQAEREASKWPYDFIQSEDVPKANQRGSLTGQLLVRDKYMNESDFEAAYAYVGLAEPGEAGSWQTENKAYQFWAKADENGSFSIENIRTGNYSLYAFVPGIIGDYVYQNTVTIEAGSKLELENLVYEAPRNGPTLWEIGIPDRTASEFYVPDPLPTRVNPLYINKSNDKYRQYGLWDRYTDLYPTHDLVYTINSSDYRRDWFFAHVNRKVGNNTYQGTTWQVRFNLEEKDLTWGASYTLRIALASATNTHLRVQINDQNSRRAILSTHFIGRDNSIARHGIHGLYRIYSADVAAELVRRGNNTLYLSHFGTTGPFEGLLYDYIRFEAPPSHL